MGLPTVPVPRETVEVAEGITVEVRGLSHGEATNVGQLDAGDLDTQATLVIAYGTDTPTDEVKAWRRVTPRAAVDLVLNKIVELSGMGEEAGKESSEG